jgi:peptide/nickel transport system permease protein
MTRYVIRRLVQMIPLLIGVSIITFTMTVLMPGDYVSAMISPDSAAAMTPEQLQHVRASYGLDKPAYERYLIWLRELLKGNLGYALDSGLPVINEIGHYLPPTLVLTVSALLFSIIVGVALGIISAIKQYSWIDQVLTVLGFVWISTPGFVFAIGAIFLLSLKLRLLPTSGMADYGQTTGILDLVKHLILPASILGLNGVARYMRYTRASVLDVIRQDYLTVARAKGLSERVVMLRHMMRNALIPVLTLIGLDVPWVLSGAIIIEAIFAWPGMGTYYLQAVHHRDYMVIMGINFTMAVAVVLSNLLTDLSYAVVDPRIRYR